MTGEWMFMHVCTFVLAQNFMDLYFNYICNVTCVS